MFLGLLVLTLALGLASIASAHAVTHNIFVNGEDQGDGESGYIRSPYNTDPVRDLKSSDLACNTRGGEPVPEFVKVSAGDELTLRWYRYDSRDHDDVIDPSHKGPILTYIAPYTEGNGAGPIWSKIAEEGFENGEWATIRMIENRGKVDFHLPKSLAPGQYLIRQEVLALHMADTRGDEDPNRGAESYPSCVQIEVEEGPGEAIPDQDFDFNEGYKYDDPGIFFDVYNPFESYTPPGPPVWGAD